MRKPILFFDAYGTIFEDLKGTLLKTAGRIVRDQSIPLTAKEFLDEWTERFWLLIRQDFRSIKEANRESLELLFHELDCEVNTESYVEDLHSSWLKADPYPEVSEVFGKLVGFRKAIVSNADEDFLFKAIKDSGLSFEFVICSESARSYKPEPRIFQEALRACDCKPTDVIHVGDSLESDVKGANNVGIESVWVNRERLAMKEKGMQPDHEIEDLRGLLPVLRGR